jgi:hypothetical protein
MQPARAESVRDQDENAFTAILRRLFWAVPAMISAVFVDMEGECIDYVTSDDPFEAKVSGAHMHMLLGMLRGAYAFELVTSRREVWVRRLSDDYLVVVTLARGFDRGELRDAIALAGREFREEVGIDAPHWEKDARLSVRVRTSPGWTYAPEGFSVGGERVAIAAVLGRWTEPPPDPNAVGAQLLVCFRVRTPDGQELTLAHDETAEAWQLRE